MNLSVEKMSTSSTIKYLLYIGSLIAIFLIEPFYKQKLYTLTEDYVISSQTPNKFKSFEYVIVKYLDLFGGTQAYCFTLLVFYAIMSKARVLYYIFYMILAFYSQDVLKSLYKDPRPYMT